MWTPRTPPTVRPRMATLLWNESGPAAASYAPRQGLTEAPTVKDSAMTHPPPGNGPWRVLILDSDPADPKWIVATVARPEDVRRATPGGRRSGRGNRRMG